MEIPGYIAALLQPQSSKPTGRKVWSIDLETVWLPFFTATNVTKATAIPADALGAPLRLQYEDDGEVKFSNTPLLNHRSFGLPRLALAWRILPLWVF